MAPSARFRRAHSRGKNSGGDTEIQVVYNSPSFTAPLDSARHAPGTARGYKLSLNAGKKIDYVIPAAAQHGGGQIKQSRSGTERLFPALILFLAGFFSCPLASERSFYTLFFAGLQVKGVALDLLDNVFLLHLAFKAAQSVLEGLALLKPNFCQIYTPPDSPRWTE